MEVAPDPTNEGKEGISAKPSAISPAPCPPPPQVVSFRDQVYGSLSDLLDAEGDFELEIRQGLLNLVENLARYREEGTPLFPEVFVSDKCRTLFRALSSSESLQIGEGSRKEETVAKAVKQCAPLAREGWAIYLDLATKELLKYGVFRIANRPLVTRPTDGVSDLGTEMSIVSLVAIAENTVKICSGRGRSLEVHFTTRRQTDPSPTEALGKLVAAAIQQSPSDLKGDLSSFLENVLLEVLQAGHGTLAAVSSGAEDEQLFAEKGLFRDGVCLTPPHDILARVRAHAAQRNGETIEALLAQRTLLTGMLLSDGITVFTPQGSVLGYNCFVRQGDSKDSSVAGGARHRAYHVLCEALGKGLGAAFIQSQDGATSCEVFDG